MGLRLPASTDLTCHVERIWVPAGYRRRVGAFYLRFYTEPLVYHVWFKDDGTKTQAQFLAEQVALARAHKQGQQRSGLHDDRETGVAAPHAAVS